MMIMLMSTYETIVKKKLTNNNVCKIYFLGISRKETI